MAGASSGTGGVVTLATLTTVLSGATDTAAMLSGALSGTLGGSPTEGVDGAGASGMAKPAARSSLSSIPAAPAAPMVATPRPMAAVAKSARRRRSRVATRFSLRQRRQTGMPGPTSWGHGGAIRSDMAGSRGGGTSRRRQDLMGDDSTPGRATANCELRTASCGQRTWNKRPGVGVST